MTTPDWLVKIERLLNDATPDETGAVSHLGEINFLAASPTNQRKLISALKVALEALEKIKTECDHTDTGGELCECSTYMSIFSEQALSAIQKIGEEIK